MKKLVLMSLSILVLMLSPARSARAQVGIAFPKLNVTPKVSEVTTDSQTEEVRSSSPDDELNQTSGTQSSGNPSGVITFNVSRNTKQKATPQKSNPTKVEDNRLIALAPDDLFNGGADSLVAKAVGHAEGTRTANGGKTWAYRGHVDPGNGVWNLGSFSYQHGASSPEDADVRQLNRLRRQYEMIRQTASSNGLRLGLEEQLNGIDLANQAPLAALSRGGYIDRLRQAYAKGLRGSQAVLHARTYSFINPNTNRWDAPGLGNNYYSISRDQARRLNAISDAIESHQ
jgi:hypothetical protein